MTAISFNLTPSKSIDVSGLPLEGLPPLEAGRTLPDAFAELLGKASKAAGKPAVEGDTPGEPKAAEADIAADGDGVEASVDAGMRPTAKAGPAGPFSVFEHDAARWRAASARPNRGGKRQRLAARAE